MPATSPATYGILTLSCLLYFVSLLVTVRERGLTAPTGGLLGLFELGGISVNVLVRLGASLPLVDISQVSNLAQPWRFVTAVFLHASLLHIIFNMWVLMDVGPMIEETYGSARFCFIYVTAGIGGYIFSSSTEHLSVGGSGALLGLIGVLLAMTIGRRSAGMQALRNRLLVFLVYVAVLGYAMPAVDNFAHAGGFVTGFILGKIMTDRPPVTPDARKWAYALGWATALVVAASFAMMLLWVRRTT